MKLIDEAPNTENFCACCGEWLEKPYCIDEENKQYYCYNCGTNDGLDDGIIGSLP